MEERKVMQKSWKVSFQDARLQDAKKNDETLMGEQQKPKPIPKSSSFELLSRKYGKGSS